MRSLPIIPIAVFIFTLALLGWGYIRSRKFGKLGLLSWLQFVVLMSPWLIYFGLFVSGIFINFTTLLSLLVGSTIAYVLIGNQLRKTVTEQRSMIEQKIKKELESLGDRLDLKDQSNQGAQKDQGEMANEANTSKSTPLAIAMSQAKNQLRQFQPIPAEDLKLIQGIFGIETYYVTETIPYQEGAIFKGNLRGEPDQVYARLNHDRLSALMAAI